jgi:hypothetical protein
MFLLLFAMAHAALTASTIIIATCNDGGQNQQVSGSESATCYLSGQAGTVSGLGTATVGNLDAGSSADSNFPDPYATVSASWDVVFPTPEQLTWQFAWTCAADYSMTLDMAGQYAPLYQWISQNLDGATWSQTVASGKYTFTAYTQDYGEGSAQLSAALIGETPVGDPPAPEPGTWMLAGGALAAFGLKIRWERSRNSRATCRPAGCFAIPCTIRRAPG